VTKTQSAKLVIDDCFFNCGQTNIRQIYGAVRLFQSFYILLILLSGMLVQAAVTPIRFYHLGENDPGVGHAVVAANSLDSVSTNALILTGSPKYWAHAAPGNTNSAYSILFSVGDQGTAAVVTNTGNVCLEAWANTGWRTSHVVVYNGDSATDGYGFVLSNNTYLAVLGGVGIAATIPCPPGSWMHLAMVCSNGVVAVFTNGTLAAVTNATPIPPTGNLFIGGPNVGTAVSNPDPGYIYDYMHGFVDDVRISTFAPGGFKATDLLYTPAVPAPLSIGLSGGNAVVWMPAGKNMARLQTTTNLTSASWQNADAPEVLAVQQARTNSIQGTANFYRLNPAAASPVPAVMVNPDNTLVLSQGAPSVVTEVDGLPEYTIPEQYIDGEVDNNFDASGSVDLLSDSTNTLSYRWVVFVSEFNGGMWDTSLPDYASPVLPIPANSLPQLLEPNHPGPYDSSLYWRVKLHVRHIPYTPNVGQESIYWFRFQYLFSSLDISLVTFTAPSQNSEW
jgi:hypothetical protein